jgi:hypothetical protein
VNFNFEVTFEGHAEAILGVRILFEEKHLWMEVPVIGESSISDTSLEIAKQCFTI